MMAEDLIYLLTAIGLTPGGSRTAQIYTNNTQNDTINNNTINDNNNTINNRTTQLTTTTQLTRTT